MIPSLISLSGCPYNVLPSGIFAASFSEIATVYAYNPHRAEQFDGLVKGARHLLHAGCSVIYLDGSYVTSKVFPGDFDVVWWMQGVNFSLLPPVFSDFNNGRQAQKLTYGGEFFPDQFSGDGTTPILDFFQIEKYSGHPKGIIRIDLTTDAQLIGGSPHAS